jgi:hypothetical protein
MEVVVSTDFPFQVLQIKENQDLQSILISEPTLNFGDSILKLTGPLSDSSLFQSEIINQKKQTDPVPRKVQFVIYNLAGSHQNMIVTFTQHCEEKNQIPGCRLRLEPSAAITLREAFEECGLCKMLVSARSPYVVHMMNRAFSRMLGCAREQVLGRELDRLELFDCEGLDLLAEAARNGQSAGGRVSLNAKPITANNQADASIFVACFPVVEAANGVVKYMLIVSHPGPNNEDTCEPHTQQFEAKIEQFGPKPDPGGQVFIPPSINLAPPNIFASALSPASLIIPRRRAVDQHGKIRRSPAAPVVVTPELLSHLQGLSLSDVARTIGVSPTALKKALRKLGIKRWVYRRRHINPSISPPGDTLRFEWEGACAQTPQAPPPPQAEDLGWFHPAECCSRGPAGAADAWAEIERQTVAPPPPPLIDSFDPPSSPPPPAAKEGVVWPAEQIEVESWRVAADGDRDSECWPHQN